MKKVCLLSAALCLCLAACATEIKSGTPTPDPVETQSIAPTPSSTPEQADLTESVEQLIGDYFEEGAIQKVNTTSQRVEVQILYSGDVSTATPPEDWQTITDSAISACAILKDGLADDGYTSGVIQAVDTDGNILLTVIDGKSRYSKYATSNSSGENPNTITLEEFNAIQTGMSYDEVFEIIGGRGEVISETDLGLGDEYISIMFKWDGEGSIGANANVLFQGGKVSSKAQFGLE